MDDDADMIDKPKKKIPVKVLRYFPIIPILKRLYQSTGLDEQLIWHATNKSKDGKIRQPSDSLAWKYIDKRFPAFASDERNLRLGLAVDGFNPFGDLSATHSCWPVMLVVYNFPPQMCMQAKNIILSMLIPGKKQPGNDIDVYLQPLIDDLGATREGKAACPICGDNTLSNWLTFSRKTVYMNHRRFVRHNHPLRQKFNGEIERREKPPVMSGATIFEHQSTIVNDFGKAKKNEEEKREEKEGKKNKKKKKKKMTKEKGQSSAAKGAKNGNSECGKRKRYDAASSGIPDEKTQLQVFKKRSIFLDLAYWKDLLLRHNIDVMHTKKNVCESVIGTILNIKFKTKDGLKSRNDLKSMGIRSELHPQEINGKTILPPAPYSLINKNKAILYNRMRNLKVPYGYSSDLRKHFSKDGCLGVLKAHDYHVLMQQVLPVSLRGLLPEGPSKAIFRLCSYFHEICQRVVHLERLVELEVEVDETLCMLETYFPPSFFDVMVHLTIHLAREVRLCGPVQYRWIYPFERYMKTFKEYVKNYALPEACITECYLGMEMHMDELKSSLGMSITGEDQFISIRSDTFGDWFKRKVYMQIEQGESVSNTVEWLAKGPLENCVSYKRFLINGSRFLTKDVERVTQNSGVSIESKTLVVGQSETISFYGVLEEILVLDYITLQVPIFKCDWAHTYFGMKLEKGFTLVNLKQHKNQFCNDPFILASQARPVFYSRESDTSNWYVMLKPPPKGFHELEEFNEKDASCQPVDTSTLVLQIDGESESYAREDAEPIVVVPTKKKNKRKKKKKFTS
ncbi:uncharacterized protein LOC113351602 [Papaver somniferum]|uniref:uncharacterized protein LOC113351602 n=1 Tax=Papaver somniferum TaxID=3469 RepID=UPI000E6F9615|nr:uncharacterized protein LOC113351602 [Papaver somniferum]